MVCFKPIRAWQKTYWRLDATPKEHEREKKITFKEPPNKEHYRQIEVPCGHCLGCRLDKANEWAVRASLELNENQKNTFLTLTYAKAPTNNGKMTLRKKDVQNFIKRLRKSGENLSYIICGEYGDKTHRPHYHCIIFGYWPDDTVLAGISKTKIEFYYSESLEKIWGHGYVTIEKANYNSIAYTTRYTQKKAGLKGEKRQYTGEIEKKIKVDERYGELYETTINKFIVQKYDKWGREKEFILTSKKPAIGLNGFLNNKEKILKNGGIIMKINDKTVIKPIPKYFLKKITAEEKAYYLYQNEKIILKNREEIIKRIKTTEDTVINEENAIKKHHEYLKKNLEERAKLLKREQN